MPKIAYESKRFGARAQEMIVQANRILEEYEELGFDLTLRQLYYQFVARGLLANRQQEYKRLGDVVNNARLSGLIDWDHIVDRTRQIRGRFVYHREGPGDALRETAKLYATDLWRDQPTRIEVWIEKDALVGVIQGVCWNLDVPYFSCRGYTSQSEAWAAGQRLLDYVEAGQDVVILHLGDHDPSGIDMTRDIEDRLTNFIASDYTRNRQEEWLIDGVVDPAAQRAVIDRALESITVDRIALTWEQIEEYQPPPNPAKQTDSRFAGYMAEHGDESWELDALPPDVLAALIEEGVERHRDPEAWARDKAAEEQQRSMLADVGREWRSVEEFIRKEKEALDGDGDDHDSA